MAEPLRIEYPGVIYHVLARVERREFGKRRSFAFNNKHAALTPLLGKSISSGQDLMPDPSHSRFAIPFDLIARSHLQINASRLRRQHSHNDAPEPILLACRQAISKFNRIFANRRFQL